MFYAADKNYDGTIDQTELQNILGKLGVKVRHHTMKKVMKKICDQRNGSISFQNFMAFFDLILEDQEQ